MSNPYIQQGTTPVKYDPTALKKLYDPQAQIKKEQDRQNKVKQQQIQNTNQQQQQILQQQKNPYSSFISGPESYKDFDIEQSKNNIAKQLKHQIGYMDARGYKYRHQKDMPFIEEQMALHLSKAGIQDLRQLGSRATTTNFTIYKKGDKYFRKEAPSSCYSVCQTKEIEIPASKISNIKEEEIEKQVQTGMIGFGGSGIRTKTVKQKIIKADVETGYELINKDTGEKVVQGKYGGMLTEYDKGQGFRWGNTTRTEGMTDFMIKFDEKGEALIYPRYEDTASDLSGIMTVGSIALAATGVGAGLGASFLGGAAPAVQSAVGNAFINASISSLTGGDFTKTFLTSAAVPIVSQGMNSVLSNSIFKNMPVGDSFRRIAGSAINSSVTNGVVAAINGQDITKAMYRGAIRGGTSLAVDKIFTPENMQFLTQNTNLSLDTVRNIGTMGITKGVHNILNNKSFTDGVIETMVSNGVSASVANKVGSSLKGSFENNPELLSTIQQTSFRLTNMYVNASMAGRQVSPAMLQQLMIETAMRPTLTKGIEKTKEIAKKASEETRKSFFKEDDLKIASVEDIYSDERGD